MHKGTPRVGDQVVELPDVTIGYDHEPPLVTGLDLLLGRRERLGIVGANGSGKSTLLDVIAGRREPLTGQRVQGPTVQVGLHDQRGRDLDPQLRVRQAVAGEGAEPDWWDTQLLERFWFDSDVQKSPIELLSGGERRRLQLVLTLSAKPNVLLLDEPTNDLDLDTLRALEDFLDTWRGAVVIISHDRAFLDRTVDDVLVIDDGRARRWPGGYAGWLTDREGSSNVRTLDTSGTGKGSASPRARSEVAYRSRSTVRHELKTAEKAIAKLETVVARSVTSSRLPEPIMRRSPGSAPSSLRRSWPSPQPRRPGSNVRPSSRRSTASADGVILRGRGRRTWRDLGLWRECAAPRRR